MATAVASTQQAGDHERRHRLTVWSYGLLAQRLCNFMADDGVIRLQMMAGVLGGGAPSVSFICASLCAVEIEGRFVATDGEAAKPSRSRVGEMHMKRFCKALVLRRWLPWRTERRPLTDTMRGGHLRTKRVCALAELGRKIKKEQQR